jgi:ATP-dependent DNA helicase RecG
VGSLRGVGSERLSQLERLGLRTVSDLLLHCPRRYEDRRALVRVCQLPLGEPASVRGRVVAAGTNFFKQRTRSVFEIILDDGSGRLHCRWWNLPFMANFFAVGDEVWAFGKPVSLKPRTMDHPETEVVVPGDEESVHLGRIVPVYPLTEGLPQRWLRSLMWRVVRDHAVAVPDVWSEFLAPGGAAPDAGRLAWMPRADAIRSLHFPAELADARAARERLALDELAELQVSLLERRRRLQSKARGLVCSGDNTLMRPFLASLGLKPTEAQKRVLREIRADMSGGKDPMRRLLQGDVGSGKTLVAACAALMTIESGFSVVLMAPTEILAEQHHANFTRWFASLGVGVEIRTGTRKSGGPSEPSPPKALRNGPGTIVIGTHALVESGFQAERLGLVIIDEQHKFGVSQRESLLRKGHFPHLLVMTATPIPRTLALTLYGDLDVSVIDEFPAGRGGVRTFVRSPERLPKVWSFVRSQLDAGRQAYIVYPLVEGNDLRRGRKAVVDECEKLRKELAPHPVGLLHGRLAAEEKERVMGAFRRGELKALLATSVIEVGVDVPNATVLVIESAEQFGLAQLHQLRGRIGRGRHESFCILVGDAATSEATARLRVMEETVDGFRIAEEDLRLRGPGEFLGKDQSGLPPFRFADLRTDAALVGPARDAARRFLITP